MAWWRRRALNRAEMDLYAKLQRVAATDSPLIETGGRGDKTLRVGRSLAKRRLALVDGHVIRPTPAAIEFRRLIAARQKMGVA
ncbi:hypothetical protein [Leifsonia aquatica]|uniref:hypothetical protein n=1 Tax=Leifsonia aquatica TaxID=144185 RepID=UPI0004681B1B|nr:hypothetical protein [Leifsonia aquatica]